MTQLLSEFPAHTYDQWHAAAEALLKGAPFEKLLVSKTYEDITIQPLYREDDIAGLAHRNELPGAASRVRGSRATGFLKAGWEVSQELKAHTPAGLNAQIHEGLKGGQTELNLAVGCGHAECCKGGVALASAADVSKVLEGVQLDAVSTYWQAGPGVLPVAAMFVAAAEQSGVTADKLRGGFEIDPLSELVAKGFLKQPLALRLDQMASLTAWAAANAPGLQTITANGCVYHNAGASATQELAYVIATVVAYVEELKSRGIEPATAFRHLRLRFAVGSDYFMEIAKLRAARWLLSKVAAAYGVEDAPVYLHASTSRWNKTSYDAHTNMLRVTSEAFAAVVAGVDALHIGPYDEISGKTDEFSRRVARNIHVILREECGLDQVIDPAGGSNYIEWLTDQVAAKSWSLFQEIEAAGGMVAALQAGTVQAAVAKVRDAKFQNIRRRKDKIVGSNMYPDLKGGKLEMLAPVCHAAEAAKAGISPFEGVEAAAITPGTGAAMMDQAIAAAKTGASRMAIAKGLGLGCSEGLTVQPLPPRRAAEEYEALRDASAAFAAKTGAAPVILQVNFGPSGRYRLRADWTAAFFQAAGFTIDGARDFKTIEEAAAAAKESAALIAVITSDDASYAEHAANLAAAVKAARPDLHLLLAGAPGDNEAAWRAAGVDDFVNVKSNNYDLNQRLLTVAGVMGQ
jgi:methylmalonyl-CoA mutase